MWPENSSTLEERDGYKCGMFMDLLTRVELQMRFILINVAAQRLTAPYQERKKAENQGKLVI